MNLVEALAEIDSCCTCISSCTKPDVKEALLKALGRDWAVRVLDAWAALERGRYIAPVRYSNWFCIQRVPFASDTQECDYASADTPDAARLAAARAVFPELPESVRAELGGEP